MTAKFLAGISRVRDLAYRHEQRVESVISMRNRRSIDVGQQRHAWQADESYNSGVRLNWTGDYCY